MENIKYPFIQNIPLRNIVTGEHLYTGPESMALIQIINNDYAEFPKPLKEFKEVYQFRFLDIDKSHLANLNFIEQYKDDLVNVFSAKQAEKMVAILKHCLENKLNVIVHCHAGVSRSGAIASVAGMNGFYDVGEFKTPNLLIKDKLMFAYGHKGY